MVTMATTQRVKYQPCKFQVVARMIHEYTKLSASVSLYCYDRCYAQAIRNELSFPGEEDYNEWLYCLRVKKCRQCKREWLLVVEFCNRECKKLHYYTVRSMPQLSIEVTYKYDLNDVYILLYLLSSEKSCCKFSRYSDLYNNTVNWVVLSICWCWCWTIFWHGTISSSSKKAGLVDTDLWLNLVPYNFCHRRFSFDHFIISFSISQSIINSFILNSIA